MDERDERYDERGPSGVRIDERCERDGSAEEDALPVDALPEDMLPVDAEREQFESGATVGATVGGPGSGMRHPPFTGEAAREAGRKGGKASGEARRMRGEMREVAQVILSSEIRDERLVETMRAAGFRFGCGGKARYPTVAEAMLFRQVAIAIDPSKGNEADSRTSFRLVMDATSGRIGRPIEEEEAARATGAAEGGPTTGFEDL